MRKKMTEREALESMARVMRVAYIICAGKVCMLLKAGIYRNCTTCHIDRCIEHVKLKVAEAGYGDV